MPGTGIENIFSPQIQIFEPFGAHVDPSRTNMSSKQILQLVTSRMNEVPFMLNKAYRDFTEIKSPYFLRAQYDGIVINTNHNILFILYYDPKGDRIAFEYIPEVRKIMAHGLHLRYVRPVGAFKVGDLLFDYSGQTEAGLPKVGYRTKVMFGSFLGYTAEDAMVISESYSKRAQVDYFDKLYIPITKKHKYFKNETGSYFYKKGEYQSENFSKYVKVDTSLNLDSQFANISEESLQYYIKYVKGLEGAEISEVKIHRINPKSFQEIKSEYKYNPDLIKEISEIYTNQYKEYTKMIEDYKSIDFEIDTVKLINQLFVTYKSAGKLPTKLLNEVAEEYNILDKDIDYLLEIDICQTVPTVLGDKFANCFAGKGTISMIIPDHLMPLDPDGNRVDLIFNPLGIYGRNNWGSIFELGISKIVLDIEKDIKEIGVDDNKDLIKDKIKFINDYFIMNFDEDYYFRVNNMLAHWDNIFESFKKDVLENGFYLCVDNFPGISYKTFFEEFVDMYSKKYNLCVTKQEWVFTKELWDWLVETRKFTLNVIGPNGEGIEDLDTVAYFGDTYYLKLFHTANSKYNSVSMAKKYNKANGQPARGRKEEGGQHTSWMTTTADRGHSDNSQITYELSTIKSDCIDDKDKFFMQMVYQGRYQMQEKGYNSKTYEGINHALGSVGMKFVHLGNVVETSRATEEERINSMKETTSVLSFEQFNSKVEEVFTDFDLVDIDLESLIEKQKESDYLDDMIGGK